jgi:hypothetical protein
MAGSFRSNIREALLDPESTQGTARTLVADAGSSASLLISGEFTETLKDELREFLLECLTGHVDNVAAGFKRIAHYYYQSAVGYAHLDDDAWPQTISPGDTFRAHLLPRTDKCEMTPDDQFSQMDGFLRDSFEKYPDDFQRTLYTGEISGKLGGMGTPAAYDTAVSGSGTTLVVTTAARWKAGMVIHVGSPVTDRVRIKSISGSTCTLYNALAAPLVGGEVLRAYTSPGEWGWLMAAAMGEAFQSGHAALVVGAPAPTASVFSVTAGYGAQFAEEGIIEVLVGSAYEVTQITDISTDAITVDPPLSGAPSTGALVRPAWTMRQDIDGFKSFGMTAYFHKIKRRIHGISIGDMSLDGIEGSALPKITLPLVGMGDEDTATDTAIPTALVSRKFNAQAPKKTSAKLLIAPATAGATTNECRQATLKLGNEASVREAITGTDGVAGTDVTAQDPVLECSINTTTLASYNPRTALKADTLQRVVLIIGSEMGRKVVIWMNEAQIKATKPHQENERRDYYDLEIRPKRSGTATIQGFYVALL